MHGIVYFHALIFTCRRPIIQSGFRSSTPAYPLLHVDALNTALEKASFLPSQIDPVLYVNSGVSEGASACCHVQCADMYILCPISQDRM